EFLSHSYARKKAAYLGFDVRMFERTETESLSLLVETLKRALSHAIRRFDRNQTLDGGLQHEVNNPISNQRQSGQVDQFAFHKILRKRDTLILTRGYLRSRRGV